MNGHQLGIAVTGVIAPAVLKLPFREVADGFKGRLLSYALVAGAGHLVLLRRLVPGGRA